MVLWLALAGCVTDDWQAPEAPPVVPGAPRVGAAEGYLKLPVGTPLSGYTARCSCLGSFSKQDDRDSAYTTAFIESVGVQTYPTIKVIWLENGDDHLVITKTDSIYSFDGLVGAITERLEEATGESLDGRVVHTTNHSHSSWGTYSDAKTFYLGSDRFNRENFERFADQVADIALTAYDERVDAKVGLGWAKDWDPDDRVYRDRRGENNELVVWDDQEDWVNGKDPHLGLVRFDTVADEPIAMMLNFGMHGILGSERNPLASSDSGGGLESRINEVFEDEVVVMFTQGSGGDASPAGDQDDFARQESVGENAVDAVMELYDLVETSADPISMQSASQHIWKHPSQIHVTRDGEVDWYYTPYEEDYRPDDVVYDESGALISPIDEFNTMDGAVFCGSGDLDFPVGGLTSNVEPYSNCLQVELLSVLIEVFFELDELELPLVESLKAGTMATRVGPIPTLMPDGERVTEDWFAGFFPGEPTAMYGEQWRRRVNARLGLEHAMIVGYSQDHEGYLLIAEDWLAGGYEPDISLWGPLEAEHVMEGVLDYSESYLDNDVHDDPDPLGHHAPTEYDFAPLPTVQPDLTPDAGTRLSTAPGYLWSPFLDRDGDEEDQEQAPTDAELVIPPQLPRVQGIVQLAWIGGDPAVDHPQITIERLDGGEWAPLRSHSGRLIDTGTHDTLLAHTPDPQYPADAEQTHYWWAGWQAVAHVHDRPGLPLGTYRLKVEGHRYAGGNETWPWDSEPYAFTTEEFELVPAHIDVVETTGGLSVSLPAPEDGWRYVIRDGDESGDNPVPGPVHVRIETPVDPVEIDVEPEAEAEHRSFLPVAVPTDWTRIVVTDAYGNTGELLPPVP